MDTINEINEQKKQQKEERERILKKLRQVDAKEEEHTSNDGEVQAKARREPEQSQEVLGRRPPALSMAPEAMQQLWENAWHKYGSGEDACAGSMVAV
jgi:hypothetical protein